MLEYSTDGLFHIFCNVHERSVRRQRFTVAHELGHYFIDEHRLDLERGQSPHCSFVGLNSDEVIEREADFFASRLLMPQSKLSDCLGSHCKGMEAVLQIAKEFQVSTTSAAIRYAELNLHPCVIMYWNSSGLQWKRISDKLWNEGYRKTIEDSSEIVQGSATDLALRGISSLLGKYHQAGTTAECWFPFLRTNSERNLIMLEQSLTLGRFGALTYIAVS